MADNVLEVGVRATLQNAKEFHGLLQDAINKKLIIFDDKDLSLLASRIQKIDSLLNQGLFEEARKYSERLNTFILGCIDNINVEIGGTSNNLQKLHTELAALEKEQAKLRKTAPELNYRQDPNSSLYHFKRGALNDQQLTAVNDTAEILKLNQNWSVGSYVGKARNYLQSTEDPSVQTSEVLANREKITKALTELGYTYNQGILTLTDKATKTLEIAKQQYDTQLQNLQNQIETKQQEIKLEQQNTESPTVKNEAGSLNMKEVLDNTTKAMNILQTSTEQYNKTTEQAVQNQKRESDALEQAALSQKSLTTQVNAGTSAMNNQNSAVGRAVTTFFGYQMILRQLRRLWREAINTIKELDKQLTTQAMVTGMTREQTWNLVQSYQEIAQATGLAQTTIAGVTTEYLRQGESINNALTLTRAAAAAATVAGISAQDSVKYLTTAIHGFKLEAEDALEVSDKFAALAAQAATNYEDLAVALSKVASQAALAGMSMDYTLALLTTGLDVTQEAPESIGTALKTVIARMREISDYGKTLEDDTDLNQVESGLRAVNIELRDGTGELRSTEVVLDELGRKWETLTANQQAAVAKALAGTRQQSRLVAIMENYDKVLDYQQKSVNSIGATTAQQVTYLKGMEAATNNLQSVYQSLIKMMANSNEAIGVVNTLKNILQWIGDFLKQPAGRTALLATVGSMLLKSQQIVMRIKATIDQLIRSLSGVRQEEQRILNIQNEQLTAEKQKLAAAQSSRTLTSASVRPNGWLSNDPTKSTSADVLGQLSNWIRQLVHVGPGWRFGMQTANQQVSQATSSWWQNNSLVGKIRGAVADRKTVKTATNDAVAAAMKAEEELAALRKRATQITQQQTVVEKQALKAAEAGDQDTFNAGAERLKSLETEMTKNTERRAVLEKNMTDLKQRALVLNSNQLSNQEKMDYLAREQMLVNKQEHIDQINAGKIMVDQTAEQKQAEIWKTEEEMKQLRLEQAQTAAKGTGTTGKKLSGVMSKASGYIAAASTAIAMILEWKAIFRDFADELANTSLEESKRIQSQMYQNTQLKSTIISTSDTIGKLSKQVVKTTDDLKELEEAQTEFAEALGLSKEEVEAMSADQIQNLADAKQRELDEENVKLAKKLNETLTSASYNRNGWEIVGNIAGKTAMGAGAGTMVNAGWGTLIGAIGGLIVGAGEEITKAAIAADAKNKINALLETEEGVDQFKYALKLNYKDIAQATTEGGKEMANAMSAMFSSIVELFDKEDFKAILEKFNYNMVEFAAHFNELLNNNLGAVKTLSDDKANISQRVKAAQQIDQATSSDEQINAAFRKINYNYLEIGNSLSEASIAYADKMHWSLSSVSAVVNAFGTDLAGLNKTFENLRTWLQSGAEDGEQLSTVLADLSTEEIKAIKEMITGSRSLQDVADTNTRNRNKVSSFRETQAKWNTMSESEQQQFIDDNIAFFRDPEALRKFLNGEDITQELIKYQADIQKESKDLYEQQRQAILIDLETARKNNDEVAQKEAEAYLAIIEQRIKDVDKMFDLSLEDIVNKQNEQVEKLKEMYQAEEDALIDSLNKRKEAYQKYFDSLEQAERVEEYTVNRDQLMSSISRLSAGTDATSRNKLRDLQKQLKEVEEQEAKQRREDARQAVLDNIDDQVSQIQDDFEKLLSNNKELLSKMDASTELQYRNYLATLGLTEEDIALRVQQLGDLFKGTWGEKGVSPFTTPTTTTPNVTVEAGGSTSNIVNIMGADGQMHDIRLTAQQMRQLAVQLVNCISEMTGMSVAISSNK